MLAEVKVAALASARSWRMAVREDRPSNTAENSYTATPNGHIGDRLGMAKGLYAVVDCQQPTDDEDSNGRQQ